LKTLPCIRAIWLLLPPPQVSARSLLETSILTAMRCFDYRDGDLGLSLFENLQQGGWINSASRNERILASQVGLVVQHLSTFTLSSVIGEIRRWSKTGCNCFTRWVEKRGLLGHGLPDDSCDRSHRARILQAGRSPEPPCRTSISSKSLRTRKVHKDFFFVTVRTTTPIVLVFFCASNRLRSPPWIRGPKKYPTISMILSRREWPWRASAIDELADNKRRWRTLRIGFRYWTSS